MSWITTTYFLSGAAFVFVAVVVYRARPSSDAPRSKTKTIDQLQDFDSQDEDEDSFVKIEKVDSTLPPPDARGQQTGTFRARRQG